MSDFHSQGYPNGQRPQGDKSPGDRNPGDQNPGGPQNSRAQKNEPKNSGEPKNLADQARGVAQELKSKAGEVTDTVRQTAKDRAADFTAAANDMAGQAREQVEAAAMHQKSLGADYVGAIAGAMNRAAGEFDAELPQAAHYIRQASEQVTGFADTIRQRDMRELAGEVQTFARNQPTLFFGGAVILGFAALRFFKSASVAAEQTNAFEQRREGQGV
jgi:uncharacterized protein YjbJ (UPF0337 family)